MLMLLAVLAAAGAEVASIPVPPAPAQPTLSLTIPSIGGPAYGLQAEVVLPRRFSFAARAAYGNAGGAGHYFVSAAQVRYYFLGNFARGLHLGAEALFARATNDSGRNVSFEGVPSGGAAGLLVGAKYVFATVLTIEAQVGARTILLNPKVRDAQGGEVSVEPTFQGLFQIAAGLSL